MSYTQLGTFTGMYGLLAMVLSVPAGVSAKRFGERRVLAPGLLGVAAGSLLLGEAWSVESAIAFRGLTIFGYRFAFVSVLIAVALTAPPALRGRTMGVLGATSALASVIAGRTRCSSSATSPGGWRSPAMRAWPHSVQWCSRVLSPGERGGSVPGAPPVAGRRQRADVARGRMLGTHVGLGIRTITVTHCRVSPVPSLPGRRCIGRDRVLIHDFREPRCRFPGGSPRQADGACRECFGAARRGVAPLVQHLLTFRSHGR
jgi:MFS family permease